jgi:hypothetical protein
LSAGAADSVDQGCYTVHAIKLLKLDVKGRIGQDEIDMSLLDGVMDFRKIEWHNMKLVPEQAGGEIIGGGCPQLYIDCRPAFREQADLHILRGLCVYVGGHHGNDQKQKEDKVSLVMLSPCITFSWQIDHG